MDTPEASYDRRGGLRWSGVVDGDQPHVIHDVLGEVPDVSGGPASIGQWEDALQRVVATGGPALHLQPVVDLRTGEAVGFEALARFSGPPDATPDVWFAAAGHLGFGPQLEAQAIHNALARRGELPRGAFLALNVTPGLIGSDEVSEALLGAGSLEGVVIELTEHSVIPDYAALGLQLDSLRDKGGLIAVDDAGTGYAGLQWLSLIKPDFVKADRSLVSDIDHDEVKLALLEMLGAVSGRLDAWLLAEGVERNGELDALVRIGVPLAQGYLLARPSANPPGVDPAAKERVRSRAKAIASGAGTIAPLVEDLPWEPAPAHGTAKPMRVKATEAVCDVAERALARSGDDRWEPLLCVDAAGAVAGYIRVERLVEAMVGLARTARQVGVGRDCPAG